MRESFAANRPFLIVIGAFELVLLAMLPLALLLDHRIDRQRPMYQDLQDMATLQYRYVKQHGEALPLSLAPGEMKRIEGVRYTTSAGTSVAVESVDGGYCIRTMNGYGDATRWLCWNNSEDPRESVGHPR